jgi:hypothetical protein
MKRFDWLGKGSFAAAVLLAAVLPVGAQDTAPSVLNDPALADLDDDCMAIITLLEQTPGTDIATLPESEVEALEPGSRECVLRVQELLGTDPPEEGTDEAGGAAPGDTIGTPEAQSEALTGVDEAEPATGEAVEQDPEEEPDA